MDKERLRTVSFIGGQFKGKRGLFHGIFQYGDSEYGLEANAVVELEDGRLMRESIEYVRFEEVLE